MKRFGIHFNAIKFRIDNQIILIILIVFALFTL